MMHKHTISISPMPEVGLNPIISQRETNVKILLKESKTTV
jgi:hypothetical protein